FVGAIAAAPLYPRRAQAWSRAALPFLPGELHRRADHGGNVSTKIGARALLGGLRMAVIAWAALSLRQGGSLAVSSALLAVAPLSALWAEDAAWAARVAGVVEAYGYALWFAVLFAGDRLGLRSCEARIVASTVGVGLFALPRQLQARR